MVIRPLAVEEVQEAVCAAPRVLPRGGGTKPALSTAPEGVASIDLSGLRGVTAYVPEEFTFTALAGTPLAQVVEMLAEHGQCLPFDPPFAGQGATLGGTVAAGLSGPGRYQYGGVRDFLLGARYVDGEGRLIYAGGKVVKNAAGFDIPKLMVGSLGRLGVLVELSFKVFPKPETTASLRIDFPHLEEAVGALQRLSASPLDLNAVEIVPSQAGWTLWARLAGSSTAMPARLNALRAFLGGGEEMPGGEKIPGGGEMPGGEGDFWGEILSFAWVPQGWALVKAAVTPRRIAALEPRLQALESLRRYSGGGQAAWIALPGDADTLNDILRTEGLPGVVLFGPTSTPLLGLRKGMAFARRVKAALDPVSRFLEISDAA
jgi:glycolate oxidase FAD binding subunit